MYQIPSQEPEVGSSLMFMPQQGTPIQDLAIRKHLKQQVMQHVGRYKRKRGLQRRQKALQYPLHIDVFSMCPEIIGGDRTNTNKLSKPQSLFPEVLLKQSPNSADGGAVDSARCSFDRLGAGRLDPFAKYPFKLDDRARELIHTVYGANSGTVSPFTVVAFRTIWVEVSVIDAAAFHQFLAGARAYFDFLRTSKTDMSSVGVIAHRACSLRLLNAQLSNTRTSTSDGVITAILLLARYYQMIGDFGKWRMHMLGLKEIIQVRGDVDNIGMDELLRKLLSNVDISGSFALDAAPIFPIPAELPPPIRVVSSATTSLSPPASCLINIWRSTIPNHMKLIDIIDDICIESLHFREQIQHSKGGFWTETMYICHHINPLMHRLLHIPEIIQPLPSFLVVEALRLGASIYLAVIRYAFGISPLQSGFQIHKIRTLFDRFNNSGIEQAAEGPLQELGWGWVKIWILGSAAITSPLTNGGQWFLDKFHAEMDNLSIETYSDFEEYIGSFLWIPEVHGVLLRNLGIKHQVR